METFWRTKGKRIAAWLMIALIMAISVTTPIQTMAESVAQSDVEQVKVVQSQSQSQDR